MNFRAINRKTSDVAPGSELPRTTAVTAHYILQCRGGGLRTWAGKRASLKYFFQIQTVACFRTFYRASACYAKMHSAIRFCQLRPSVCLSTA